MVQQLIPAPTGTTGTSAPAGGPLDDEDLLRLYAPGDGPLVRFNFVSTADGAASSHGKTAPLGTAADQRIFALLRRHADVILVGAGTIRAEGYAGELLEPAAQVWRTRHGMPAHPGIAVVSGSLDLDPASAFFTEAPVPILVLGTRSAAPARRKALARVAEVVDAGENDVDPRRAVAVLAERGHHMVHSEGGPTLFAAFQRADAVDSLCLSISPLLGGGEGQRIATGFTSDLQAVSLRLLLEEDGALFTDYRRERH